MTVSLISSGLSVGSRFPDDSPDHEWSRETMAREADLIRRAEAIVPTDFNGLAKWMGYRSSLLRHAIGRATSRQSVISRLRGAGIRFQSNDLLLADAYLAEIAADAGLTLLAAE